MGATHRKSKSCLSHLIQDAWKTHTKNSRDIGKKICSTMSLPPSSQPGSESTTAAAADALTHRIDFNVFTGGFQSDFWWGVLEHAFPVVLFHRQSLILERWSRHERSLRSLKCRRLIDCWDWLIDRWILISQCGRWSSKNCGPLDNIGHTAAIGYFIVTLYSWCGSVRNIMFWRRLWCALCHTQSFSFE